MGILSKIFGGDDGHDTAERILAASGTGVTERGAAPAVVPAVVSGPPPPGWVHPFFRGGEDAGTAKTLTRPYERSVWVQRAIKHVSEPIASMPLRFATMGADGLQALVNPALAAFWEWPAVGPRGPLSRAAVVEATVGWLKLAGEAFWVLSDSWLLPRGSRDPFIVARPDQMRHIVSQDGGRLLGWVMRDANGREWYLLPEQVIHNPLWNPYDPIRGCPEYASARVAAEADAFAGEFGRNLMAGNGDRGPIISSKNGALSDPQMQQIEAALRAKKAAAQSGQLKTTFFPADVTISDPQIAQVDAEFVAARIENRKEIYMAFGVPSSMAEQMHRATTAHESDRYILIEDTCKPMAVRVAMPIAGLAMRMLRIDPQSAGHLTAYFDFEQHSIMLQARTERIDAATKLAAMGMPFREINAFLNLQAPPFAGDDVGHLPINVWTVAEANSATGKTPATPPGKDPVNPPKGTDDPPEDGGDDPTTLMLRALAAPVPSPLEAALAAPVQRAEPPPTPPAPATDERELLWQRHMQQRRPAERTMQRAVNAVLFRARADVLRKLEATAKRVAGPGVITRDDDDKQGDTAQAHPGTALDVMFDQRAFTADLTAATQRVSRVTIQTAGEEVRAELGVDDPWTVESGDVFNALASRANLIQGASEDIFDEVRGDLGKGYEAGETTAQLAARVREKFNDMSKGRSETIAQTETGAIYGAGRTAGAASVGAKTKSWLSARDVKVRDTHKAADGQVAAIDGLFKVGADTMPSPCNGSLAEENCNCRCVLLFHV